MRPRLVVVPGYRVPMEAYPRGLVGKAHFATGAGKPLLWWRRLERAVGHLDLDLFVYNWPNRGEVEREQLEEAERLEATPTWPGAHRSPSGADAALPPWQGWPTTLRDRFRLARLARARWRRARSEADRAGANLHALLRGRAEGTFLVGHSLGGKVALRALEAAGKAGEPLAFGGLALGPAVLERNLDWAHARAGTMRGLEVFHGRRDRTLGLLYRLGNLHLRRPVGLVGMSLRNAVHVREVDITRHQSPAPRDVTAWRANHNWYRDHIAEVLAGSGVWAAFAGEALRGGAVRAARSG